MLLESKILDVAWHYGAGQAVVGFAMASAMGGYGLLVGVAHQSAGCLCLYRAIAMSKKERIARRSALMEGVLR